MMNKIEANEQLRKYSTKVTHEHLTAITLTQTHIHMISTSF